MTVAQLVAADYGDRLRSFGRRAPARFIHEVAGLTVVGVGVEEPWGVQIIAMPDRPDPAEVAAAIEWCRIEGHQPQVVVRAADRDLLPECAVADELPALVAPTAGVTQDTLTVSQATDVELFRAVYRESFAMRPGLVEALVVPADLAAEEVTHLLGWVDGRAVACAQLRHGAGRAHVSGLGVVPEQQRRGYGAAMLAAARHEALALGCELVWLNAAPGTVAFYEAIGFTQVDTYIALACTALTSLAALPRLR